MRTQIGSAIIGPAGQPLPLTAGVEIDGIVYLSGQLALINGKLVGDGIEQQTKAVIDAIEKILAQADLTLRDVFKVAVWLTRKSDFAGFNAIYGSRFSAPYPVRSTVISDLVLDGALVEIEVTAARSDTSRDRDAA
ncbi:RidA family protein [Stakelama pacifica]|uniref:Enamine deaminase RidA (YjgF/YER057c/UK114 family) n=1 Tax=Stakelama pacifica TaxID=517720 RepID=A0A4V3BS69_9SPHN|nr:RidA family protein [Stakelama pacifica]TDN78258.1 enamine deaminase RidA (YjgF/YER057c/UK114 family) [Stakelama pacifica]GGO99782.1 reactive intermediate/imine deaminase [Stakelama pacifica]